MIHCGKQLLVKKKSPMVNIIWQPLRQIQPRVWGALDKELVSFEKLARGRLAIPALQNTEASLGL